MQQPVAPSLSPETLLSEPLLSEPLSSGPLSSGPLLSGPLLAWSTRAGQAGDQALAGVDLRELAGFADQLDQVALLAMAYTLRRGGLFTTPERRHWLADIYQATAVAPRHRRIIRRWLWALRREGMLAGDAASGYHRLTTVTGADLERASTALAATAGALHYGPAMSRFLSTAMAYLPELLRDEINLQALLFDDDDPAAAEEVYRRNVGSRHINRVAASLAGTAAARITALRDTPVRVLEVGAGVGGTTDDVLAALADRSIAADYLFTDVSTYFLTAARQRLAGRPGLRFGHFDINRDYRQQGYRDGESDLILAANVLHNAGHAEQVLAGLRRLLAPGGALVFIETSRDHYQLMTSMEFLMSPAAEDPRAEFTDFRRGTDRIFPTRTEWLAALRRAGFAPVAAAPDPAHPITRFAQYAYLGLTS